MKTCHGHTKIRAPASDLTERERGTIRTKIFESRTTKFVECTAREEEGEVGGEKNETKGTADSENIPMILFRDIAAYSYSPCKNCIELAQRSEGALDFPNRRFVSKIFKIHCRRTVVHRDGETEIR